MSRLYPMKKEMMQDCSPVTESQEPMGGRKDAPGRRPPSLGEAELGHKRASRSGERADTSSYPPVVCLPDDPEGEPRAITGTACSLHDKWPKQTHSLPLRQLVDSAKFELRTTF